MSGSCFKYRGKLVLWDSGMGNPWYVYTIFPKGSRDKNGCLEGDGIEFGYNDESEKQKTLKEVKLYIDKNLDKLMDCGLDTKTYNYQCKCKCEIYRRKSKK